MKRTLGGLVLLAALGGQALAQPGSFMKNVGPMGRQKVNAPGLRNGAYTLPEIPGYSGPYGEPLHVNPAMMHQSVLSPAEQAARATFASNLPPEVVSQITYKEDMKNGLNILQAGGIDPGLAVPPHPGKAPITAMPFPVPPVGSGVPGAVAAVGALTGKTTPFPVSRTAVRFGGPTGMRVSWYVPTPDGRMEFTPTSLQVPATYNFLQAQIYRLKLSNIPQLPGRDLYPTLEIVPANAKTATFLAHNSVPLTFTNDDFEQVAAGNYLVKVIYLPYPQFQDLASTGANEVTSARLEAGMDPIAEAQQRGHILLVIRIGNIDLENPNAPAMDAPSPYMPKPHAMAPGMGMPPGLAGMMPPPPPGMGAPPYGPGMPGPGPMVPYGMRMPGMQPPFPRGMVPPGMQNPQAMTPPPFMAPPPGMGQPGMLPPPGAVPGPQQQVPTSTGTPLGAKATEEDGTKVAKKSSWLPSFLTRK